MVTSMDASLADLSALTLVGFDLRLFVDAQHQRVLGRTHVEADDVPNLVDEKRVLRELAPLAPCGWRPKTRRHGV